MISQQSALPRVSGTAAAALQPMQAQVNLQAGNLEDISCFFRLHIS